MIERVKLLMSVKNLSSAQLAVMIGVQRSGISHILSGRNKPSLDFVLKVLEAFPEISEAWLLQGKGEMLKNKEYQQGLFPDSQQKQNEEKQSVLVESTNHLQSEDAPYYHKKDLESKSFETANKPLENEKMISSSSPKEKEEIAHVQKNIPKDTSKKLLKLIAIYSDDSFKVYHAQ